MIEALPHQLAGGKKNARCVGRQCIQIGNQRSSLLLGHSTVQDERRRNQSIQGCFDRIEVFRAFGQDQHLASLSDGITHPGGDGFCSGLVIGEMPKHVLNPCIGWQVDPREA